MKNFFSESKRLGAIQFVPHPFQTRMRLLNEPATPHVYMAPGAFLDMYYIANASPDAEVSWLGTVRREGSSFFVEEVILFEQRCHTATTEISEEDLARVATQMIEVGEIDKINQLKFWGHVHPSNSTSPSGQDEDMMTNIFANGNEWFVRGIFGRMGRAEFTVFDYSAGIRWDDVPWSLALYTDNVRQAELESAVKEKVSLVFPPQNQPGNGFRGEYDRFSNQPARKQVYPAGKKKGGKK